LRPEVSKNSSTALSSNEGELARSITTCLSAEASLSPSPVRVFTPGIGRGGDDLVAALAQDGCGLRADQAGTADDDDLDWFTPLVDDCRPPMSSNLPPGASF
jgi:hypothetical protein